MILEVDDRPSEQHMIVAEVDMSRASKMAWEVPTKKWPLLVVERRRIYAESLAGLQGREAIPSSACRREDLVAPPASSVKGLAERLVAERAHGASV